LEEEAQIRERTISFAEYIGEISAQLAQSLENTLEINLPTYTDNTERIYAENSYECRDINHKTLFSSDDELTNTFILRLIFSLQEINDVIWLRDQYMTKLKNPLFLDFYILLRLTTLKTDEIMDNLLNIRNHSNKQFNDWNNKSEGSVKRLLEKYEKEIKEECADMRNMIHYDIDYKNHKRNFFGHITNKINQEYNYPTNIINTIINSILKPLKYEILDFLKIEKIEPSSDWIIIVNRLSKLIKGSLRN
jgi:hypothetical protein